MLSPTSVYQPLKLFLASRPAEEQQLTLTFTDIERILGRPLPSSAYTGNWWTNITNPLSRPSHVTAWQEAGWRVSQMDRRQHVVTFIRQ